MAVTLHELMTSREFSLGGGTSAGTLRYLARGSSDETEVRLAVAAGTPAIFQGMFRTSVKLGPLGFELFSADVEYEIPDDGGNLDDLPSQGDPDNPAPEPSEPDDTVPIGPEYSFSTGGGAKKVLQSIETQYAIAPPGKVAPDFKKAINASASGVEGVDIVSPNFEFTYTRKFKSITLQYIRQLRLMTGSVNDFTFYGFEKGELLFLGADGSCKPGDDDGVPVWSISFRFSAGVNRNDVDVSDEISVPLVRAHEYLWCTYEPQNDPLAKALVQRPKAAYVEQVYEFRDFKFLGI